MAGKKKSFVLRIDQKTFEALEKWASDEFRSTNGHLEWIIHQALKKTGRYPRNQTPKI
ncbi:MAG: Arc family DNA-binding protein [Bacteroidales bacterium]|nr:Arc family DNA-binding protein [Bacteroidales bacterium]